MSTAVRTRGGGVAVVTVLAGTVFIAAGAFWLSFMALADLAALVNDPAQKKALEDYLWGLEFIDFLLAHHTVKWTVEESAMLKSLFESATETWLKKQWVLLLLH